MSVSDPVIKDLKSCIQKFLTESTGIIDDNHRNLSSFCQKTEKIFNSGLICNSKFLKRSYESPYDWICEISRDKSWIFPFQFLHSLAEVRNHKYLRSKMSKFRLLIRFTLVHHCLHVPLEYLIKNGKLNEFYRKNSVLGDEILSEILLSVFLQCNFIKFNLDLNNSYFLETTWLLPDILRLELVPSESIGISVTFSEEKAVVIDVDPYGAAAENGRIEVGDILESINGIEINSTSRGKLSHLMRKQRGSPLNIVIIKAFKKSNNNTLFMPLRKYLLDVNLDILHLQNKKKDTLNENPKEVFREGFLCVFVGSVSAGPEGDSRQIEKTIREIMKNKHQSNGNLCNKLNKHVYLQLGELSVKTVDAESGRIIHNHQYMDISSCGSSLLYYNHFGYIIGNDEHELGYFTCFIFCTRSKEDLSMILRSISQGFKRTTFAV